MKISIAALFAALLCLAPFHAALAQDSPDLGAAESFSVLAGTAVTCTNSAVSGDEGVAPGSEYTSNLCTSEGETHNNDQAANDARADFQAAFDALALLDCDETLTGTLADQVLSPGVYCFDAAATLTGALTLEGPSDGIWIFQIGADLTTTDFSVAMGDAGNACNVYWQVGGAATLTDSSLKGTVLAGEAVTITRGTLVGRAFADTEVALTDTDIDGSCAPIIDEGARLIRGDLDQSGDLSIIDPIRLLNYLFGSSEIACRDAADVNDDGRLLLTDAILLLGYLFQDGDAPISPFPDCGLDTTSDFDDVDLGCTESAESCN